MDQLNEQAWREQQVALNTHLADIAESRGLGAALQALADHQIESGFIRDRLAEVSRYVCHPKPGSRRYFSAQFNPARGRRFAGAGLHVPPEGAESVHGGCFLCARNIWWQQQGVEMGFRLPLVGGRYIAWMNPFPLAPTHCVVASDKHVPQCWGSDSVTLMKMIDDLLTMVDALPGWIGFYNGEGAGASILGHLHFHLLPRPPGYGPMPMELAARNDQEGSLIEDAYPVSFMHWRGQRASIRTRIACWLERWQAGLKDPGQTTANVIAIRDRESDGLDCYFVPRHKARSRAEGLEGVVGGFEVLGEIVCSSEADQKRLNSGEVDYAAIARILSQVSVAL